MSWMTSSSRSLGLSLVYADDCRALDLLEPVVTMQCDLAIEQVFDSVRLGGHDVLQHPASAACCVKPHAGLSKIAWSFYREDVTAVCRCPQPTIR